ncbi:hypothetical protein HDU96_009026 [Phlyctochytrium bullatum]|nr:hypothetical protein HDU96_009026 [Phlyctochytrium bullatum]
MSKQSPRGGVVINTASMAGFFPSEILPIYSGSKFAVVGFTRSLGRGFAKRTGVRVNGVAPAFAETGIVKQAREQSVQNKMESNVNLLLDRVGFVTVDNVIDAMMSLIQDENASGQVVKIQPKKAPTAKI